MRRRRVNSREDKDRMYARLRELERKGYKSPVINWKQLEGPRFGPVKKLSTRLRAIQEVSFRAFYGQEGFCDEVLFIYHWPKGFHCPHCQGLEYSPIKGRSFIQCKACRKFIGLREGTPLKQSKLSLVKWFEGYYWWCKSRAQTIKRVGLHTLRKGEVTGRKLSAQTLARKVKLPIKTAQKLLDSYNADLTANPANRFWDQLNAREIHHKWAYAQSCFALQASDTRISSL